MADLEEDYSSSDDSDYVPGGAPESDSEEEGDHDHEGANDDSQHRKGKTPKKDGLNRKRKGGIRLEGEDVTEAAEAEAKEQQELQEEQQALEEERRKAEAAQSEQKEKERADDLWSNFLSDVGPRPKGGPAKPAERDSAKTSEMKHEGEKAADEQINPGEKGDAAGKEKTVTVTKVYDFAGEEIRVKESVKAGSQEAKQLTEKPEKTSSMKPGLAQLPFGKRKPGGLGSVLGKLNKKPRMSVLDKSKMDWNSFKRKEGIEEDLKIHNKGKDGFLQKQDFLKESDLRQYEIERKLRMGESGGR